jgi:hypothetical protein
VDVDGIGPYDTLVKAAAIKAEAIRMSAVAASAVAQVNSTNHIRGPFADDTHLTQKAVSACKQASDALSTFTTEGRHMRHFQAWRFTNVPRHSSRYARTVAALQSSPCKPALVRWTDLESLVPAG